MTDSSQPPYFPTQPTPPAVPPGYYAPQPGQPVPPAGYYAPQPGTPPGYHAPQPGPPAYYSPRPVYEGLTKRQKRAAAWAGAIGLNVMSFGGTVLVAVALIALLAVTFAGVSSSAEANSGLRGFDEFLAESQVPVWLGVAAAVGVVVLLLGMFLSVAILRAGRVRRPFAVTWSAFGVTVPVLTVLNFIGGSIAQFFLAATVFAAVAAFSGTDRPDPSSVTTGIVVAVILVVISIVVIGIIGWLAWWWMAHAFRERIPVASAGATANVGRYQPGDGAPAAVIGSSDGGGYGRHDPDARGGPDGDPGGSGGSGPGGGGWSGSGASGGSGSGSAGSGWSGDGGGAGGGDGGGGGGGGD